MAKILTFFCGLVSTWTMELSVSACSLASGWETTAESCAKLVKVIQVNKIHKLKRCIAGFSAKYDLALIFDLAFIKNNPELCRISSRYDNCSLIDQHLVHKEPTSIPFPPMPGRQFGNGFAHYF